ncbi:MAG: putative ABC transporter permease [Coriobacteriales bacterium]|nr:putative ABC transporter permease [Coriobacteriales bacterium]
MGENGNTEKTDGQTGEERHLRLEAHLKHVGERSAARWHHHRNAGYIRLNFYNLFWIFVICSVIGLGIETVYTLIVTGGDFQSRAGLVWGPFSPIYGFGAVLMTITLNRFWNRNPILIFLVSLAIGMTFEYAASWLLETMFGVVSWSYSNVPFNIQGRTSLGFGLAWGLLGVLWIRLALPRVLHIIDRIPWHWHIPLTVAMTAFMVLNIVFTISALDRYYERSQDIPATRPMERVTDDLFPDSWMQSHFENMTLGSV